MLGGSATCNRYNENNKQFFACKASAAVERILSNCKRGKVHSVFNNSLNLQFGENFVHIGSLDNGLAPFGVALQHNDVQRLVRSIRRELQISWNQSVKQLILPGGLSISFKQTEWANQSILKKQVSGKTLLNNRNTVANRMVETNWQTGLSQSADDQKRIMDYLLGSDSKIEHSVTKKMDELGSLARGEAPSVSEFVFEYWIGRGLGLTPSGDDVITGMCAMLSVLGGPSPDFLEQLKIYLQENGLKRTTPIGYEYLQYAVKKQYHTHLIEVCTAIISPQKTNLFTALEEIKKIGYTSGADTMIGVLLGIRAINP